MATFDFTKAAGIITSSNQPVLGALGAQFGVPQCMLDFTKEILSAFPSPVLNDIQNGIKEGKSLADSVFKDVMRQVFLDTGIVEYDTTLGRFVFVSSSSNRGVEQNALQALNNLNGLGTILGFGAQAVVIGQNIENQIEGVKNCIDQFKSFQALQKGPSAIADKMVGFTATDPITGEAIAFEAPPPALEAASQVYDDNKETLEEAAGFIAAADKSLQAIQEIKQARAADPENNPEPVFWNNMPDPNDPTKTLGDALSGLTSFNLIDCETDAFGNPIVPTDDDQFSPFRDIINVSGMLPPVSVQGQFLFSRTGIYYDSYGGGLDYSGCITNIVSAIYYDEEGNPRPGAGVPPEAVKYLHEYNPNIGGKGEIVNWHTFNKWANTAFDLDYINEDPQIQEYYDTDHFLQVLIDNRNREIYDLSSYIGELKSSGYTEDSAVLSNQRQVLFSKISDHDHKIKRRKKQIELQVLLAPPDNPAVLGEIPINSFQNLDAGLISVEQAKQENLLFNPGEVSGVVLPLCPTFIKSDIPQDEFTVKDLLVPEVGVGQIITSDPGASGTSGTVLSLTDMITTDKLAAVYNFLDADLVLPDSNKFLSINCATSSTFEAPTQIVASSVDSMFPSGIGVPYFRGICNFFSGVDGDGNSKAPRKENQEHLYSAYRPYGYGRIQEGFDNLDSILYRQSGATFDFWTHVPDLGNANDPGWNADNSLSSLHRVVLGCENRGGDTTGDEAGAPPNNSAIKGLLMGFSRDRRLTKNLPPTNNPADNDLNEGLVFHMSPTQSINTSSVTFLTASGNPAFCIQDEVPPSGYYGISVDTSTETTGGHKFDDCSSAFVHTAVTVDYGADQVTIYLNGEQLATASVAATFGTTQAVPPNIPSNVDTSSFSYSRAFEGYLPPNAPLFPPDSLGFRDFWFWEGPSPKVVGGSTVLTPWIIGGGYTDGMHVIDFPDETTYKANYQGTNQGMNFMGGEYGGKKSGLHGFIGSLKLYNKALSAGEVLKNYNAQKGFFTNIRTYSY